MTTFEEEALWREEKVPVAAEALFARPLFRMPAFVFATVLGFIALAVNIRLGIAAVHSVSQVLDTALWAVGCILVTTWFGITSHLEDIRAFYLNERSPSGGQESALSIALMSDFRTTLGGMAALYSTAILLQLVVWRLLLGHSY